MAAFDDKVAEVATAVVRRDAASAALTAAQIELRDAQQALDKANERIQSYVSDRVRQGK